MTGSTATTPGAGSDTGRGAAPTLAGDTDAATTRVAVVGIGRMGGAMARRLAGAGFPITLYNRTRERAVSAASRIGSSGIADGSEGTRTARVKVAATAAEAAAAADVVIVALADDAAVSSTYAGDDGLASGLAPGCVVLEASTIAPSTAKALAPLVAQRSAALLDAPVSGSVPVVERGELTVMVGGDAAALPRVRPVLDALATRVFHLGPLGAGATMKLAVNAVVHALNQALSEALVLSEKAGVDRTAAYDVFAASAIAAPFVHYKRDAFLHPEHAPVAFMLDLVAKDLDLIAELSGQVGARMDQMTTNREVAHEAVRAGYGPRDLSAIAELLRAA